MWFRCGCFPAVLPTVPETSTDVESNLHWARTFCKGSDTDRVHAQTPVRPAHLPYIHFPAWPSFLKPDRILVSISAMLCLP